MSSNDQRVPSEDGELAATDSTLAQLSYAPTIQTTVVTTTTTTTTAFPPFVLRAPRNLNERDPELYPLAFQTTPHFLKRLRLELDGNTAFFEEAADPDKSLNEVGNPDDVCYYFFVVYS